MALRLYPGGWAWKNSHASAWHLDLDRDVRSLMSVEPNPDWYETAHHELGHVYYYMSYSRPEVPLVLRLGANRAYHEGIGSMIGMASLQRRFLAGRAGTVTARVAGVVGLVGHPPRSPPRETWAPPAHSSPGTPTATPWRAPTRTWPRPPSNRSARS